MAHPKRRQSKSRKNKRRSNIKLKKPALKNCKINNYIHLYHHAYWHENKLYYKGKILFEKQK